MSTFTSCSPVTLESYYVAVPSKSFIRSTYSLHDERNHKQTLFTHAAPSTSTLYSKMSSLGKDEAPKREVLSRIRGVLSRKKTKQNVESEQRSSEKEVDESTPGMERVRTESKKLLEGYNGRVEKLRLIEYPGLKGRAYLDNAGTQLPAKSLIDALAKDLISNVYGNPHTHSLPARNSSSKVTAIRRRALEFFNADPEQYDLVFVANASAAIKIAGESIADYVDQHNKLCAQGKSNFWYGYHKDAHNSLIGARELTGNNSHCFKNDQEVEQWIESLDDEKANSTSDLARSHDISLFAYPGQSNMTGRRLPLRWLKDIKAKNPRVYTLLDAAGLATTKQLDLNEWQPDFTAVSFYKIFGFPDLGGLIVKKSAAHILSKKKYFAGGTVDGVTVFDKPFMVRRGPVNEQLEEGTLPFHNIITLGHALDVHEKLFASMDTISSHVLALTRYCFTQLRGLRYATGQPLCEIYSTASMGDASTHGGTLALNIYRSDGSKIGYRSVEQEADSANIYVRSGAMCNPGGMASHLEWSAEELEMLFEAGMRCTNPIEIWKDKWTGVVRVSFGANSVKEDVDMLVEFLRRTYVNGLEGQPVVFEGY